jgi:SAM-dependent methyltransferase
VGTIFVHPYTKRVLERDADGNLFCLEGDRRDVYKCYEGCFDFSMANADVRKTRDVYDEFYMREQTSKVTLADVTEPWLDDTFPWRRTMLENLGSLSGRQVLLLGNGASYKEFYFLHLGARVVFTDVSLVAARRAQSVFRGSGLWEMHREHIEFHAVDAMHLPFPDESFDVIYGSKFVGFLNNLSDFFSEVRRCLKPGGICRFSDDAYSPAWDAIRRTLWQPIKARFLWKSMSPLDRIRSGSSPYGSFGFKEELLTPFIKQFGFSRMVFVREYFLLRIAQLCWGKLVRFDSKRLSYARPLYFAMMWLDNQLARTSWMRRNRLALTWGFDK